MGKFFGVFGLLVLFATGNAVANEIPENETREQMIERVMKLPPEPNAIKNNLTILGVDVNNNNIRDNVERKIAFDLFDNKPLMRQKMRDAQIWNEVIIASERGDDELVRALEYERAKNMGCDFQNPRDMDEYLKMKRERYSTDLLLNDSFLRNRKRASVLKAGTYPLPSNEGVSEYCAQFK